MHNNLKDIEQITTSVNNRDELLVTWLISCRYYLWKQIIEGKLGLKCSSLCNNFFISFLLFYIFFFRYKIKSPN